ncbi:MAG TPA: hypothetical protein PKK26_09445 [Candidatus Wallbacteria bacterium]|nr:hypothetical protein [Candidatus Wallbacteria bacterium]
MKEKKAHFIVKLTLAGFTFLLFSYVPARAWWNDDGAGADKIEAIKAKIEERKAGIKEKIAAGQGDIQEKLQEVKEKQAAGREKLLENNTEREAIRRKIQDAKADFKRKADEAKAEMEAGKTDQTASTLQNNSSPAMPQNSSKLNELLESLKTFIGVNGEKDPGLLNQKLAELKEKWGRMNGGERKALKSANPAALNLMESLEKSGWNISGKNTDSTTEVNVKK